MRKYLFRTATVLTLSTCLLAVLAATPVLAEETGQAQTTTTAATQTAAQAAETAQTAEETEAAKTAEAAQAAQGQAALPANTGPFDYEPSDILRLHICNHRDYTYVQVDADHVASVYNLLMKAGKSTPGEVFAQTEGGFFVTLRDGSKHIYTLVPGAVRLDETAYPLSSEDYAALLSIFNETVARRDARVEWLAYMTPERVASITYQKDSHTSPQSIPADKVLDAATIIRNVRVVPDTGNAYGDLKALSKETGNTIIKINFSAGIAYTILVDKESLTIQSSDMTYGVTYKLETSKKAIENTFDAFLV